MAYIQQRLLEQKLLKAARARRQFKAIVRDVIHNMFWLDDYEKHNESRAVIMGPCLLLQRKGKKLFTMKDIATLRKRGEYRTKEEILHLNKLIGKLKCFRPYPENVQLKLIGVTYFEYFGPNRVLIKQNQEGHAMYFLLSGEVVVTKSIWDEITNTYIEEKVSTITPGNIFGEIALLQNVPRTATCTTTAPCELLVLKRDDFDRILKANMMERWEEIKHAMKKFEYFDQWDSVSIRECCLLSEIESYSLNEVVYGDGKPNKKNPKMVYFLIEGRCSVIEQMYVKETVKQGLKSYKYYKAPTKEAAPKISLVHDTIKQQNSEVIEDIYDLSEKNSAQVSFISNKNSIITEKNSLEVSFTSNRNSTITERNDRKITIEDIIVEENRFADKAIDFKKLIRKSTLTLYLKKGDEKEDDSLEGGEDQDEKILHFKRTLQKERFDDEFRESRDDMYRSSIEEGYKLIFLQICTLEEKASFTEGDLMKNRRILALCPVKVLLIPAYWLELRNRANMWTRIDTYLHHKIPSTESVFKAYVRNKKWIEYKKKLRDKIISQKKFPNNTTIHDVPYSVRALNPYK